MEPHGIGRFYTPFSPFISAPLSLLSRQGDEEEEEEAE